jgi:hypothetical protein
MDTSQKEVLGKTYEELKWHTIVNNEIKLYEILGLDYM